jgi:hypothetical protein
MDLQVFPRPELEVVLRALRGVAASNDVFSDAERQFVASIAAMHGVDVDVDALRPISPEEVAWVVRDAHARKRVVQLAIVMALVEGQPSSATERAVRLLANALEIEDTGLDVLYDLSRGHTLLARIEMMRRMRTSLQKNEDFPGFLRTAAQALGLFPEDPELAARHQALGQCAPGSFGRALHSHFRENGFAFPGEKHGAIAAMFHDVGHVLSGYGVDPQGEIQQAAFQAGFKREDGFLFLLFGVLQFHLGLRLTPVARSQQGLFDVKRVLRAAERGAACKQDFSAGFDYFAHADAPLERLRADLGIPPL